MSKRIERLLTEAGDLVTQCEKEYEQRKAEEKEAQLLSADAYAALLRARGALKERVQEASAEGIKQIDVARLAGIDRLTVRKYNLQKGGAR